MPFQRLTATLFLLATGLALAAGQTVQFLDLTSEVPGDWVASKPSSDMRLLQFTVPATGDAKGGDAEMVVYYFGQGQGGSLDANVKRWASQFSTPGGDPVEPVITPLSGKMPATLVELKGNYARGVGMGPTGDAVPDRMLLAAVVETPSGNLYPQMHGPADLVAAQKGAFVAFIEGIAPAPAK